MTYSMPNIQQKICLATVSTKNYWTGTQVMINSFLKQNKWFDGDIIIITDDLRLERKVAKIDNGILINPSIELSNKVDDLCQSLPIFSKARSQFFFFEIFKLHQYQHVIFVDSDMLFVRNMSKMNLLKDGLLAVQDPAHFRGFNRDRTTFSKISKSSSTEANCFTSFFNTGFVCVSRQYMNSNTYNALLSKIDVEFLKNNPDLLTDESIFNHVFEGSISSLALSNNCPVHLLVEGHIVENVSAIHFTGKNKPWLLISWLRLPLRTPKYLKYLVFWLRASLSQ